MIVDETKVREKVRELLPSLDLESATQRTIQQDLEAELGCPLSEYEKAIREEIDTYLLYSIGDDDDVPERQLGNREVQASKRQKTEGPIPEGFIVCFPLSDKRFVGVRSFRGKTLVDVREFYTNDAGVLSPGSKGMSMTESQFQALCKHAENVSRATQKHLDDLEETLFPLSPTRRITVRVYAGNVMVDLREFYEKDGEMRPGKKGISLKVEQWNELCKCIPVLSPHIDRPLQVGGAQASVMAEGQNATAELDDKPLQTSEAGLISGGQRTAADGGPSKLTDTVKEIDGEASKTSYELSNNRHVRLENWKGADMVDIREFYVNAQGDSLPGKKGISLSSVQAKSLLLSLGDLDKAFHNQEENFSVSLSAKRKATVSNFKGRWSVDVREYYEKDGVLKPGQKGISLPREQWEIFKYVFPRLVQLMN
eukprot:jgi/Picsp_1/948/NSC_04432-R1_transcriptional coactivator p15